MRVICNAARCYVQEATEQADNNLTRLLRWIDKSAMYQKHYKNLRDVITHKSAYRTSDHSFHAGLLERVLERYPSTTYEHVGAPVEAQAVDIPPEARPCQIRIVEAFLDNPQTMCQSPTGSGKSWAAAYTLRHFPESTALIVVPKVNLLKNLKATFERILQEPIGMVGQGKHNWERVTVGTLGTLRNYTKDERRKILQEVEILMFDEAHRAACNSCQLISESCVNAYRRYGLTATAHRKGGDDIIFEGVIGPTRLRINETEVIEEGNIMRPTYYCIEGDFSSEKATNLYPRWRKDPLTGAIFYATPNGKPLADDVYKREIVENVKRNDAIAQVAAWFENSPRRKGTGLILVGSVKHGQEIVRLAANYGLTLPYIYGDTDMKERQARIEQLRSGELPILCSSGILNEGEDITNLELVILAAASPNLGTVKQCIGRALRIHEDIDRAVIIDFMDTEELNYMRERAKFRRVLLKSSYGSDTHKVKLEELKDIL